MTFKAKIAKQYAHIKTNRSPREEALDQQEALALMEAKFITNRAPQALKRRVQALHPTMSEAAEMLGVGTQTLHRWYRGASTAPDAVFAALDLLEEGIVPTNRPRTKFGERVMGIRPVMSEVAGKFETNRSTMDRWCAQGAEPPGYAWLVLELLEGHK